MNKLLILMALVFSASTYAGAAKDLNQGLVKGYVKLENVKANHWLEKIEAELESEYDFSENVSYVFEDLYDIIDECDFKTHENMDLYEEFTAEDGYEVVWKKAVKKNKSVAYIAYLIVPVHGPYAYNWNQNFYKTCDVIRGSYVVDRKGKDISDSISVNLDRYFKR